MVGTGWLKRFENKLVTTLKAKPTARRGRAPQNSAQEAEVLEDRSLLTASALFLTGTGELSIELGSNESVRVGVAAGLLRVDAAVGNGPFLPATSIGTVQVANVRSINIVGGDEANTVDLSGVLAADFTGLTTISVDGANGHDCLLGSPDVANSLNNLAFMLHLRGQNAEAERPRKRRVMIPDDPTILSYLLAGIVQVDAPRRQALLEAETTEARLHGLLRLIDREIFMLERRLRLFSADARLLGSRRS